MLCGFTVEEYIKKRRLTLAGSELVSTDGKIIDIAMKYGYDSPDIHEKIFSEWLPGCKDYEIGGGYKSC